MIIIKEILKNKSKIIFSWVLSLLLVSILFICYPLVILKSYAEAINTYHDLFGIKLTTFNDNTSNFTRTVKIDKHKPYVITITANINRDDDLVYFGACVSLLGMEIAYYYWSICQPCEVPDYFAK